MATYYLMNNVRLGTVQLYAGRLIDDTQMDTTAIQAVGGKLVASSTTGMATASGLAIQSRLRGEPPETYQAIMNAALDEYQQNFEAAHDTVATNTTGLTVTAGSVRKLASFAASLPAPGVTMHATHAGGAAINYTTAFTNPLPRRSMVITRSAAGPASVDYTVTIQTPDGGTADVVVAVASGGTGETTLAGVVTAVTTTVDPVSTSAFTTGSGFCIGDLFSGTPTLSCNGVVEALVSSDGASGTIFPTTAPNGTREFTVGFNSAHGHAVTDAGHTHALA